MKLSIISFLLTVSAAAGAPANLPTVSNVTADNISHSDALIHFNVANGPWGWLRLRWAVAPAACSNGKGGTVVATAYNGGAGFVQSQPKMVVILAGLPANSTINVCPELSKDYKYWSQGASGEVRTLPLPDPHPALPELPHAKAPDYPDTKNFATWTVGETHNPDCGTLYSCYKAAIDAQASHGTVIQIKAGTKIVGRTWVDNTPPDVKAFNAGAVDVASSTITYPGHGYQEGQGLVFATSFSGLPGYPQTPGKCDGINYGLIYYVHNPSANKFQLTCDKPASKEGPAMHFRSPAAGSTLRMAAYPRKLYPIVIRTTTPDSELPPPGTRISPEWRSKLATLEADAPLTVAPYTGNGFKNQAASTTVFSFGNIDGNVHPMVANTWLVGLELVTGDNSKVKSDDPEPWAALISLPISSSDNYVDRCYIHGRGYPNRITTAIWWDGRNNGFLNSYFDKLDYWHSVKGCQSVPSRFVSEGTNAMIGGEGPGPYLFINNYVEGAGNLWHHDGGGGIERPQNDYLYVRNTFSVPAKYQFGAPGSDGRSYYNRQPLEWKGGHRILLDGNIFDHNFHHVATSTVLFTSVGVNSGLGYGIGDVTITNNTWEHVPAVMTVVSTQGGQYQTAPINRVLVRNNVMNDINGAYSVPLDGLNGCDSECHCRPWTGWVFQGFGDGEDRIVNRNNITDLAGIAPVLFRIGSGNTEGLKVTDNLLDIEAGGASVEGDVNDAGGQAKCADQPEGERTLACHSPGMQMTNNVLTSSGGKGAVRGSWSGKNNIVADRSKARSLSEETKGMGADLNALEVAQGKVKLLGATGITAASAEIGFIAPDAQACPVDYGEEDPKLIAKFTRVPDSGHDRSRSVKLSRLKARTQYSFRVNCAVEQPSGTFRTK